MSLSSCLSLTGATFNAFISEIFQGKFAIDPDRLLFGRFDGVLPVPFGGGRDEPECGEPSRAAAPLGCSQLQRGNDAVLTQKWRQCQDKH